MSQHRADTPIRLKPWQQGYTEIREQLPKLVLLSLVGLSIPFFIMQLLQSKTALSSVDQLFTAEAEALSFTGYIESIQLFLAEWLVVSLPFGLLMAYGFLVIYRCLLSRTKAEDMRVILLQSLKKLPVTIFAWLVVMLLTVLVFAVGAIVPALLVFFQLAALAVATLAIAVPLYIFLGCKPIAAIRLSLKMDYCRPIGVNRLSAFFQIFSFQILASVLIELLAYLKTLVQNIYQTGYIPRDLIVSESWPLSFWYQAIEFIYAGLGAIIITFCLGFTVSFILNLLQARRVVAQA